MTDRGTSAGLDELLAASRKACAFVDAGDSSAAVDVARGATPPEVPRRIAPHDAPTQVQAAGIFVERYRADIRFAQGLGWLVWDETRWAPDTRERSREFAKAIADTLRERAAATNSAELWKVARSLGTAHGVDALLNLARSDPRIRVEVEQLDANPYALNVLDGTIDLRTGTLKRHDRADLITKLAPVRFGREQEARLFRRVLEEALPSEEVRAFLQRWAGYVATGVIRDHVLPVWFGRGANGKTTIAEVLKAALGDYAGSMPDGFLAERKSEKHETEIARLRGMRLGVASETANGCTLDDAKVKKLTGGDTLTGRFMRQDHFDFRNETKLVLLTNHEPRLRGTDEGIRRRVLLVPFDVQVPPERRDPTLRDRIVNEELPGVLAWIVQGAVAWFDRGERVDAPDSIKASTAAYHERQDIVGRFLKECCERVSPSTDTARSVQPAELHRLFQAWADASGEEGMSVKALMSALRESGSGDTRVSQGRTLLKTIVPTHEALASYQAHAGADSP